MKCKSPRQARAFFMRRNEKVVLGEKDLQIIRSQIGE